MNRVKAAFSNSKETGHAALLPFVCAGSPEHNSITRLLPKLEHAGASIVEIGFPYSDPVADGPTIAAAMHSALEEGMSPQVIFDQVRTVRDQVSMGIVAMVSISIVTAMGGADSFISQAANAGFDGFIFPDLPLEESADYQKSCVDHDMTMSLLISPTTPSERAAAIANASSGFVYMLARAGITGERSDVPDISNRVRDIRKKSKTSIACGFGISTPEHVSKIVQHADGAIVGSALVRRLIETHNDGKDYLVEAEHFIAELSTGLISMDHL
ncbi:MAG: tryptophan synthase subunit alpha [Phycisphaerales bacterium]|jgi:tryptophan synthase alpha chain|nr:tryptophan synthase subunit alpha [Phycisphaerales bacterium]